MPTTAARKSSRPGGADAFFASLGETTQWIDLFDHIPRLYLFVKDARGRFVRVNRAELSLHGCRNESEMLGRTDFDFHPPALAAQYVEEDRRVLESRRPLRDQVWLVMDHDRMPQWYLSTKIPLIGKNGRPVGIAGVMRPYDHAGALPGDYDRLTPVMEYVLASYGERIEIARMAERAHLSISQLQREFRKLFGLSPGDYVLKVRLLMARRRLEDGDEPVGTIALDCGFYDQSHFNRAFRAHVGMPPRGYRQRFRRRSSLV